MINEQEFYIEHETRIRILEHLANDINRKLDRLDKTIDSKFVLLIGLILTSIIIPVMLHAVKLV